MVWERDSDSYQPPTSALEKHLYSMLERPQVPAFERQVPFAFDEVAAIVDAYIPEWSTIVEADGRRWHTRLEDFERDRQRDNAALAAGLVVVRFSYRMLRDQPDDCVATLVGVGEHRSEQKRVRP
jgi:very-short-patch-repair endonuclease